MRSHKYPEFRWSCDFRSAAMTYAGSRRTKKGEREGERETREQNRSVVGQRVNYSPRLSPAPANVPCARSRKRATLAMEFVPGLGSALGWPLINLVDFSLSGSARFPLSHSLVSGCARALLFSRVLHPVLHFSLFPIPFSPFCRNRAGSRQFCWIWILSMDISLYI